MINDECNDNNDIDEDGDDNNPAEQQYNLIDDDNWKRQRNTDTDTQCIMTMTTKNTRTYKSHAQIKAWFIRCLSLARMSPVANSATLQQR